MRTRKTKDAADDDDDNDDDDDDDDERFPTMSRVNQGVLVVDVRRRCDVKELP